MENYDNNLLQRQNLEKAGNFKIEPVDLDVKRDDRYSKLKLSPAEKMQMSSLVHEMLPAVSMLSKGQVYRLEFPEGLPQTLMKLKKQPGYSSTIVNEQGRMQGTASIIPAEAINAAEIAFMAMSVATSQYYLSEINTQMELMNLKLDQILQFLEGDKRAELLANQTFVKYAAENFRSIMNSEVQRQATITSLQQARIVAMNDIEFYLGQLNDVTRKNPGNFEDIRKTTDKISQIYEKLDLSEQLFVMSYLMEMYYSQNMDPSYLNYIKKEAVDYISKCSSRILMDISSYRGKSQTYKSMLPFERVDMKSIMKILDPLCEKTSDSSRSRLKILMEKSLDEAQNQKAYYLDLDGNLYVQKTV